MERNDACLGHRVIGRPVCMHHFSLRPNEGRKVTMMELLEKCCDACFNASFSWLHRSVAKHVLHPMPRAERQGNMATTVVKQSKDRRGAERKEKKTKHQKKMNRRKKRNKGKKGQELSHIWCKKIAEQSNTVATVAAHASAVVAARGGGSG